MATSLSLSLSLSSATGSAGSDASHLIVLTIELLCLIFVLAHIVPKILSGFHSRKEVE